ncbi:MAG: hypothetical protein H2076_10910 [Planctomycetes bacterium]|nr:hypothetical protein [Planctomycetota bacterium]
MSDYVTTVIPILFPQMAGISQVSGPKNGTGDYTIPGSGKPVVDRWIEN